MPVVHPVGVSEIEVVLSIEDDLLPFPLLAHAPDQQSHNRVEGHISGHSVSVDRSRLRQHHSFAGWIPKMVHQIPCQIGQGQSITDDVMTQDNQVRCGRRLQQDEAYLTQLSKQPIDELNQRLGDVYKTVKDKGYVNEQEMQDIYEIQKAMYKKEEAAETGNYNPEESVGDKLDAAKQMIKKMMANYDDTHDYSP